MGKGGNATAKADAKEVLIEGRFYDVSSFKHPGGSIINFLSGSGADATPTYREFHTRSKKADKYLKGLPNREATPAELSRALALNQLQPEQAGLAKAKKTSPLSDPAKVAALNADFDAFREQLVAEGFFKPSVAHIIYRVLEVALLWVMGTVLLLTDSLPLQAAGAVALSLSQGRCGWLMHEGGHYSMTGKINVDRRLQEVIYGFGCGMSGAWWRNQHNKHHATPQKLQHDVDLNTLPLMAFSRDAPHVASVKPGSLQALWLKYQAFLFFPVTSFLVGLGWTLFLHPKHAARTSRLVELTCMAARYVVFYLSFAPKYGALGALGIYMLTFATACNYIFINFSVSHTHLPVSAASDYLHWVVYSAVHTTNIKNTALCNWWMSYLNFQIEHHMFPSMPQFRHPTIAPRVKALFEKHGLVYDVRPYWGAMWDTFANLHEMLSENWCSCISFPTAVFSRDSRHFNNQRRPMVNFIQSAEEWETLKSSVTPVVVDFTASWCGPCKMIGPFFDELSSKYPSVKFVKCDVEDQDEVSAACNISAMPTFQVWQAGQMVSETVGADKSKLEEMIKSHAE